MLVSAVMSKRERRVGAVVTAGWMQGALTTSSKAVLDCSTIQDK